MQDETPIITNVEKKENDLNSMSSEPALEMTPDSTTESEQVDLPQANDDIVLDVKGVFVGTGELQGQVKVLHDIVDIADVRVGDILVLSKLTPFYALLLPLAKAVIFEHSTMYSYSMDLCNLHGVPAVLDAKDILSLVEDGVILKIDFAGEKISKIKNK